AMNWFRQHLRDNPSLDDVAKAAHISPSHLRRMFREIGDVSPSDAMQEIKLQKAVRLLSESDAKIDAVATESGFSSASVFCRNFKIHKRCTPAEWRRRLPI